LTIAVSTVISAFNSLTLSPALTALLLRPRDKGAAPPLPRLAFPLAGAWLAWEYLTPVLESAAQRFPGALAALPEWALPAAAALLGAVAGWFASVAANQVLGIAFRAFNLG